MPTLISFTVEPVTFDELRPHIERLLQTQWTRSAAAYQKFADSARIRAFLLADALQKLSDREARLTAVRDDDGVHGFAVWKPLAWDSEMYGFDAARIELLAGSGTSLLLAGLLHQAERHAIRHMVARVDAGDLATIATLERSGFEMIDGIQTFSLALPARVEEPAIATRLYEERDLPQILDIARRSYIYDRFHGDPALTPEIADRIHEQWLLNSCRGRAADATIVAVDDSEVLGYATCKIDSRSKSELGVALGSIVMVATREADRHRGVARACTAGALRWFESHGVEVVEVGTQLRNIPAARLYEACGFRLAANSITLRKMIGDSPA